MKWIRWVLLKIQSGHDSVHRRIDGQGDTSIPPFQLRCSGGIISFLTELVLLLTFLIWPSESRSLNLYCSFNKQDFIYVSIAWQPCVAIFSPGSSTEYFCCTTWEQSIILFNNVTWNEFIPNSATGISISRYYDSTLGSCNVISFLGRILCEVPF